MLAPPSGSDESIKWLGVATGDDWNQVSPVKDLSWGRMSSIAWDNTAFFGLLGGEWETSNIPTVFVSTDRGATWEGEPLPKESRVVSSSRVSAIGNGEVLFAGGGFSDGYLHGADGKWRRVFGGVTIGEWSGREGRSRGSIGNYGKSPSVYEQHRIAVDRTRGDVYLTDGLGIFRLDGQFRADGSADPAPDADSDGVPDAIDAFPSDGSEYLDTDGDGLANGLDDDDDGDGVGDLQDGAPLDRFETVDTDGDGVGDAADRDDDGDGVADVIDVFPLDASKSADSDGDGLADSIDDDDDGDGVPDVEDAFPKYPREWLDTDRDGIGNNIDVDDDNDGVPDADDPQPKSGRPRPHLLPLMRLPSNLFWATDEAWVPRRSWMHTERPATHIYPPAAGSSQDYGQIILGNGPKPDIQFMIDHLDGLRLLYFDRNNNGDLSDDGPPVRPPTSYTQKRYRAGCCPDDTLQVEVSYASGITLPYTISHGHMPLVRRRLDWRGRNAGRGGGPRAHN